MRESVSPLKPRTSSSKRSLQRKAMEWESGYRSAAPLSRLIADVYGRQRTMAQEPRLHSLFLAGARAAGPTPKLVSTRNIRRPAQQDASLVQIPTPNT